jgi:hypothetical protein
MTHDEALDIVVADTKHDHYRVLVTTDPGRAEWMMQRAAEITGQTIPPADYWDQLKRRSRCPHLGPPCESGCAKGIHVCNANMSSWPGQPGKCGLRDCQACPLFPPPIETHEQT